MRSCRGGAGGGARGQKPHADQQWLRFRPEGNVSFTIKARLLPNGVQGSAARSQPPTRALRPLPSDPRGRPARPRVGRRHSPGATETRGRLFSSAGRRGRRVSPGPSAAPTPTPREGTSHRRALQAPSGLTPPGTFVSLLPKGSSCPSGDPAPIPTAPRLQRPAGPGA